MPIKYCKVSGCRYAGTHSTLGHKCGQCKSYGHGVIECGNITRISDITCHHSKVLPQNMWCEKQGCGYSMLHTTQTHMCLICKGFHAMYECPQNNVNNNSSFSKRIKCPVCRKMNHFKKFPNIIFGISDKCCICIDRNVDMVFVDCSHACCCTKCFENITSIDTPSNNYSNSSAAGGEATSSSAGDASDGGGAAYAQSSSQAFDPNNRMLSYDNSLTPIEQAALKMSDNTDKICVTVGAGMGCTWYFKRDSVDDDILSFFMHGDSWGQYGVTTDERPNLELFLNGYNEIS